MIKYHFTNDLRIDDLEQNLTTAAMYAKNKKWDHPSQTHSQASNGWLPLYNLFFGIESDSLNTKLVLENKIDYVLGQFIKKFQYPNPKRDKSGSGAYALQIREGYKIAPLRTLLKVLYYNQFLNVVPSISIRHFQDYILAEEDVVKNKKTIPEILELIKNDSNPNQFSTNIEVIGGDLSRFFSQLLNILKSFGLIDFTKNKPDSIIELTLEKLSRVKRDIFFDIVTSDVYWQSTNLGTDKDVVASYKEYINTFEYSLDEVEQKNTAKQLEIPDCIKSDGFIQEIRFGAPGTGKSFGIAKIIKESYPDYSEKDDHPLVLRTTIHSEYSYYDFVGSILPDTRDGEITYKFSPGIFTKALSRAIKYPNHDVFLIIEEMSRGNIAAIFGDTFQLLDRGEDGTSDYQIDNALISDFLRVEGLLGAVGDKVAIPGNLHIIGTVNTSDQNVNVIDTAFKRRFDFVYEDVSPAYDKDTGKILNSFTFSVGEKEFEWNCFYMSLNRFIVENLELSDDKQLGQFFVKTSDRLSSFKIIKNKVLHYLWEDVQGASLKNEKLFQDSIKSFSQLFSEFSPEANAEKIFSKEFLTIYDEMTIPTHKEQNQSSVDSEPVSGKKANLKN